jgi:hypothetical protein
MSGWSLSWGWLSERFKLLIVWLWRRAFLFFLLSIFRRWQNSMGDIQRSPEPQDVSIDCFVTSSLNQHWFYWFLYLDADVIQRVWLKQSILFCFVLLYHNYGGINGNGWMTLLFGNGNIFSLTFCFVAEKKRRCRES